VTTTATDRSIVHRAIDRSRLKIPNCR
jgi:hypothetical protein